MSKSDRTEKKAKPKSKDPLADALAVFARGDYAQASALLGRLRTDPELSEGAKQQATTWWNSTRPEPGALYVGLASIALLLIVVVATALTQPH